MHTVLLLAAGLSLNLTAPASDVEGVEPRRMESAVPMGPALPKFMCKLVLIYAGAKPSPQALSHPLFSCSLLPQLGLRPIPPWHMDPVII